MASLFLFPGIRHPAARGGKGIPWREREESAMLMAIDVGNTNMVFGLLEGEKLVGRLPPDDGTPTGPRTRLA